MSANPQTDKEVLDQMLAKQREHEAQLEANRIASDAAYAAYEAARKAAVRQEQKDLIKEAIIEALNGPEEIKREITEHPMKLRASAEDLRAVMQVDKYRPTTNRATDIKIEFLKPAGSYKLSWVPQGYFSWLWAALRGK